MDRSEVRMAIPLDFQSLCPRFASSALCESLPQSVMACDQVALGQTFRIGLSQPVSSYSSKSGMPVRGLLIESPQWDGPPAFPTGTVIDGHIASVHKVGIGLRHEIATLGIEFDRILPDDGPPIRDAHASVGSGQRG